MCTSRNNYGNLQKIKETSITKRFVMLQSIRIVVRKKGWSPIAADILVGINPDIIGIKCPLEYMQV